MISGPDPGMFQDWRDWGRELVRRNQINSLAKQIAAILVSGDGIPFAFDAKKNTITLALGTISPADIAGLNESIDDQVVTLLQAGTNIGLSYNDSANQLTISADGLDIKDEGVLLTSDAGVIDFVGAGVTATTVSGGVQISIPGASGGGGGGGVAVRDEGSTLTAAAGFLDFVGAGVGATTVSGGVQVSIPGAAALGVRDEGATLTASAGFLDFVGAGVAASTVSGGVQVSVPGATGLGVRDEGSTLTGAAGFLDFVGSGVTATTVSGGVQVSVPGGSGGENQANKAHTVPTSSGWSWVNQGSATVTDRAYSMVLFQPRIASENWAFLVRSTPSTPYTMTLRHRHFGRVGSGNTGWGVGWRTNSDGKFHICRFGQNSSWFDLSITGHNSVTSGVTTTTQGAVRVIAIPEWIKIADDGANRSVQISPNGDDWTTLWSGGRTTFTTPDQLCIGANNVLGTTPYLDFIVNVHSLVIA